MVNGNREREKERERDDRDLRVNRECRLVHYRLGLGEYYIYRGWTSGVIYIYIYTNMEHSTVFMKYH